MKLEFVNHSSFVADTHGVRLICDPWIEGLAFNKGWDLLAKTRLGYEDFRDITHIWFSHEHPDHFYPPNLLRIPEGYRKRITVLFQTTRDRNVASFCTSAGFKEVIELGPDEVGWVQSATAAEELLINAFQPIDVLVLSPEVKEPDALGLAEFVGRQAPGTAMVLVRDHTWNGLLPAAMRAGIPRDRAMAT